MPAAFAFKTVGAMMADKAATDDPVVPASPACLGTAPPSVCAGTEIVGVNTTHRIESLAVGDHIAAIPSGSVALLWVGGRRIDPRLLTARQTADFLPVRIAAEALAPNLPLLDIDLSPTALLWLDDGLVAAGRLLNGTTITQPHRQEPFDYCQIAVDGGGLMQAEGVMIASLDDPAWGNGFATPAGLADLPSTSPLPHLGPDAVSKLNQRIARRAAQIHLPTTLDPALRLVVDGRIILPTRNTDDSYVFEVSGGATDVRLVSRSVIPAEMAGGGEDRRRLGVYVLAITARGPYLRFDIDPAAAGLRDGFHPHGANQQHCWTNGYATLPQAPFALMGETFTVEVRIARPALRYRTDPVYDAPVALVLDASLPTPDRDAGSNVMIEQIKLLQDLGYAIVFVPLHNFARLSPYAEALEDLGVEVIHRPWYDSLEYLMAARGETFAVAYAHRLWVAETALPVLRRFRPDLKIIYNTADLHHLRSQRAAALTGDPDAAVAAEVERARELAVIAAVDATIVCNSVELDLLRVALPDAHVVYLPWVRAAVTGGVAGFAERSGIMFLGGFNHPPNADGIIWFVHEVMPKLRRLLTGIGLTIYGADMPPEIQALAAPDIIIAGYIKDLQPAFDRHRISIAPLRYGAGFKGKVAESLAHGVPVVASPIAAEGTGLVDGAELLIAADAETMATSITAAYQNQDLWQSLSRAGQDFVARRLSPSEGGRVLREVLVEIGSI